MTSVLSPAGVGFRVAGRTVGSDVSSSASLLMAHLLTAGISLSLNEPLFLKNFLWTLTLAARSTHGQEMEERNRAMSRFPSRERFLSSG